MQRHEIRDAPAWDAIKGYIAEREGYLMDTLTKLQQSYNDTQAIRGRVHELRELVAWVENPGRNRGDGNG